MTTGKALKGKQYAGNPYVRFDEGDVLSAATPRRGFLLYKTKIRKSFLKSIFGFSICMFALGVTAAEMEQVAYGIKWTYLVSNGKALITDNSKWVKRPETPVAIKIPQTLGGYPVEKIRKNGLHNLNSDCVRQLIIPEGVTSIEGSIGLDGCAKITSISLPTTLRVIGPEAFSYTLKGAQLTLPEGLESIGSHAFEGCRMTSISIPESVKELGYGAFKNCPIKTANIPKQIKVVPDRLFYDCRELETITLHDDITEIGDYAFSNTEKLKEVKLPSKLKKIGQGAFGGVIGTPLERIEIPNGVTSIGMWAFSPCSALETVSIPESVTSIGQYAFTGWKNLTSVTIPARFKHAIGDIFAYEHQGREGVPSNDIFTFTGSATDCGPRQGVRLADMEKQDTNINRRDVVGGMDQEDDEVDKAISWVENMCKKLWNNHRTGVCVVAGIIVLIMGMCAEMCADKKSKDVDDEEVFEEEESEEEESEEEESEEEESEEEESEEEESEVEDDE